MNIRIETPRLILREHTAEDLLPHHALLSDARAMYYLPEVKTAALDASRANLDEAIAAAQAQPREKYFLRMELRATHAHIGEIGYTVTRAEPGRKVVNLGYFTHPAYWSNGYVTEAVHALLAFAFAKDGVTLVETGCIRENIGSERVMQKCGMARDAAYSETQLHDGREKERVRYTITAGEWNVLHGRV